MNDPQPPPAPSPAYQKACDEVKSAAESRRKEQEKAECPDCGSPARDMNALKQPAMPAPSPDSESPLTSDDIASAQDRQSNESSPTGAACAKAAAREIRSHGVNAGTSADPGWPGWNEYQAVVIIARHFDPLVARLEQEIERVHGLKQVAIDEQNKAVTERDQLREDRDYWKGGYEEQFKTIKHLRERAERAEARVGKALLIGQTDWNKKLARAEAESKDYLTMLHRVAQEAFALNDTISLETYDAYFIRQVAKSRADLAAERGKVKMLREVCQEIVDGCCDPKTAVRRALVNLAPIKQALDATATKDDA